MPIQNFEQEFEAAQRRIGFSTGKTFRWMVVFTQKDLRAISAGDWQNLRFEVMVVTNRVRIPGFRTQPSLTLSPWTDFGEDAPLPTREQVAQIQKSTKN